MIFIIMGVSGAGKTTVGKMFAQKLSCVFYDADQFHSKENIEKMSRGIPLTDSNREPWLIAIRDIINKQEVPALIACSALKKSYRDFLNLPDKNINFIFLKGDPEILRKRLIYRKGHYAGADLLESQLEALEEPANDLTLDASESVEIIVSKILREYGLDKSLS